MIKKAISTFLFSTGYFIKEIENIFSRVPIRYRNTRGSLGELEIAQKFSFSQTSNRVSIIVWKHDLTKSSDLNVNARMRTEIDLNESEIDLNECEHFLKVNLDRSKVR